MTETQKIRALIIDDEPLARAGIRAMLKEDTEIAIIGECTSGKQAVDAIKKQKPDLVFLDIRMPEMDGFAVIDKIPADRLPYVIFVTAYDRYALRAFEVHALDYVLKPIDEERFQRTLAHAKKTLTEKRSEAGDRLLRVAAEIAKLTSQTNARKPDYIHRLLIKDGGRITLVNVEQIDWIEAEGNYVMIHAGRQSYLLRQALTALEAELDPARFLRIHRSTIVNISRIKELHSMFHGDYRVLLEDGTKLLLSRRYRDKARAQLGKWL